jgi:hypothetical protein
MPFLGAAQPLSGVAGGKVAVFPQLPPGGAPVWRRYVQSSIPFLGTCMARSDGLESSHASPCADCPLRASGDYHPGCRRGAVLVLRGLPNTATLDVKRDG